jgi:WD40 repeat protein
VWDAVGGSVYGSHTDEVRSVAFSPDGLSHRVCLVQDRTVLVWDAAGPSVTGHTALVSSIGSPPAGEQSQDNMEEIRPFWRRILDQQ